MPLASRDATNARRKGAKKTLAALNRSSLQKRVFIIHGRDKAARDLLAELIRGFGLAVLDFEDVANQLRQPFIADVVFAGISEADAVVALFTPDEHAALYNPADEWGALSGPVQNESRWQARPNVIFEAGVALGARARNTVIVTLGASVELFSDLSGKHILQLDSERGPQDFRERLADALGGTVKLNPCRASALQAFKALAGERWGFYDEVYTLCTRLRAHYLDAKQEVHLLFVLKQAIRGWRSDKLELFTPADLMNQIVRTHRKFANRAFWWLLIYGVFRFTQEEIFFDSDGDVYTDAINYVQMSERWRHLFRRLLIAEVAP